MSAPLGNKNAIGNRGGGRKSAYQELVDAEKLNDIFFGEVDVHELRKKIESGIYSPKDAMVYKALNGDKSLMISIFKKIFPDKMVH